MPVRGESFREMVHLKKRMNSLFNEMLQPEAAHAPVPEYSWTPSTDVFEDSGHFYVEVELPGVSLEEVQVAFQGDELAISGKRESQRELTRENVQRIERYFGRFERRLAFSAPVNGNKTKSRLENGVLTLSIPKKNPRRKIKVE